MNVGSWCSCVQGCTLRRRSSNPPTNSAAPRHPRGTRRKLPGRRAPSLSSAFRQTMARWLPWNCSLFPTASSVCISCDERQGTWNKPVLNLPRKAKTLLDFCDFSYCCAEQGASSGSLCVTDGTENLVDKIPLSLNLFLLDLQEEVTDLIA